MKEATLVEFRGSWSSGLATLVMKDAEGNEFSVPCENAPTVRALDAMFDGFIAPGHTIDNSVIKGERVLWEYDDLGLMLGVLAFPEDIPDPAFVGVR